jgi:hypothetical protein
MVTRTRFSIKSYVHCLASLVNYTLNVFRKHGNKNMCSANCTAYSCVPHLAWALFPIISVGELLPSKVPTPTLTAELGSYS